MAYYIPFTLQSASGGIEICSVFLYNSTLTKLISKTALQTPGSGSFELGTHYADMLPLVMVVVNQDSGDSKAVLVEHLYETAEPLSQVVYHQVDDVNNIQYIPPDYLVIKEATTTDGDLNLDNVSESEITASYVGGNSTSMVNLELVDLQAETLNWYLVLVYTSSLGQPSNHTYTVSLPNTGINVPVQDLLYLQPRGSYLESFSDDQLFYGRVTYTISRTSGITFIHYINNTNLAGIDQFQVTSTTPYGTQTVHTINFITTAPSYDIGDLTITIANTHDNYVIDLSGYIEGYQYDIQQVDNIVGDLGITFTPNPNGTSSELDIQNPNNVTSQTSCTVTVLDPQGGSHQFSLVISSEAYPTHPNRLVLTLYPMTLGYELKLLDTVGNAEGVTYHGIGDGQFNTEQSAVNNGIVVELENNQLLFSVQPENIFEAITEETEFRIWMKDSLDRYFSTLITIDDGGLLAYNLPVIDNVTGGDELLRASETLSVRPYENTFRDNFQILEAVIVDDQPDRFGTLLVYNANSDFTVAVTGDEIAITPPATMPQEKYWLVVHFKAEASYLYPLQESVMYFEMDVREVVMANDTTVWSQYYNQELTFDPLTNDTHPTGYHSVSLVTLPSYGTAEVLPRLQVKYKSDANVFSPDSFEYQLEDEGITDTATIYVNRTEPATGYDLSFADAYCRVYTDDSSGDAELETGSLGGNNIIMVLPTELSADGWVFSSLQGSTNSYSHTDTQLSLVGQFDATSPVTSDDVQTQLYRAAINSYYPFEVRVSTRLVLGGDVLTNKTATTSDSAVYFSFQDIETALQTYYAGTDSSAVTYSMLDTGIVQPLSGSVGYWVSSEPFYQYSVPNNTGVFPFYVLVRPDQYPSKTYHVKLQVTVSV